MFYHFVVKTYSLFIYFIGSIFYCDSYFEVIAQSINNNGIPL
ncbi:hypothetical protein PARC_a2291 [Pseudoalteromonas arctica A 37-1-2]|uniref:Uncharacterized protein n=1 Tax=Pseudoalteromonas arctica A 37-1-2 TaxID=1117313 RepID=A0A290S3Z5_9GAMM|nr:hypothetical protein PARC_a2291 [Pseudoalteromonas arctica A 37-1-2]